jgi:hypothetical protein
LQEDLIALHSDYAGSNYKSLGGIMATRAEIRTYLTSEFGAVEYDHGRFKMEVFNEDEDRSQVIDITMTAMLNNTMMMIIAPFALVKEITAEAAFNFASDRLFGAKIIDEKYCLTSTLFYDAMPTTEIAAYLVVFGRQTDELEDELGLGDKF